MAGERWSEEQTKLALFLYFQLPFGKLHSGTREIQQLADAIGRTHSAVAMKLCNFASLDPKITDTGRKGLDGASKLDKKVFAQFQNDWTRLVGDAEKSWDEIVKGEVKSKFEEEPASFKYGLDGADSTELRMSHVRIGQSFFRRAVLANFQQACCITGIADTRLLNASHIKPWHLDIENRHNPANGFALSATFDRAFDRGMITITNDGKVKISNHLRNHENKSTRKYFEPFLDVSISPSARFVPDPMLLDWHNQECYLGD